MDSPFTPSDFEPYHNLGCAIVRQAVEDYCNNELSYNSLEKFLRKTEWVKCLRLDIDKVLELAERRYDAEEENRRQCKEPDKYKVHLSTDHKVQRKYKGRKYKKKNRKGEGD